MFKEKYGEWGFVAGGSEGMGGDYCNYLAENGMDIILCGRNKNTVDSKCLQLEKDYNVKTKGIVVDLGSLDALEIIQKEISDLEIGFLVYNAGLANLAIFSDRNVEYEMYRLNVNVRSPLGISLWLSKEMVKRKKGGIIFSSSTGGIVGSAYNNTYSASKAYLFTLAEAMWVELADFNVEVLAVLPGTTIGQNFKEVPAGTPGFQTGAEVVQEAFLHLGKDPAFISGEHNRKDWEQYFNVDLRKEAIVKMKIGMEEILKQYGAGDEG